MKKNSLLLYIKKRIRLITHRLNTAKKRSRQQYLKDEIKYLEYLLKLTKKMIIYEMKMKISLIKSRIELISRYENTIGIINILKDELVFLEKTVK